MLFGLLYKVGLLVQAKGFEVMGYVAMAFNKGYLLFGLTYGIASLSCTLPIFLAVLGGSLATASVSSTLAQMALYGLGMGFVITMLTIAVALFRESMQRWMKGAMRWVEPIGTIFLFVAGVYIVYYWLTIGGLLNG